MSTETTCKATKADGSPCEAPESLLGPDGYCPAHTEDGPNSEEMKKRGREGGKASPYKGLGEGVEPPQSFEDLKRLLSRVLAGLLNGQIRPKTANAASRLARAWRDSAEGEIGAEKLEKIEEKLAAIRERQETNPKPWE